jgi:hypothetical protein
MRPFFFERLYCLLLAQLDTRLSSFSSLIPSESTMVRMLPFFGDVYESTSPTTTFLHIKHLTFGKIIPGLYYVASIKKCPILSISELLVLTVQLYPTSKTVDSASSSRRHGLCRINRVYWWGFDLLVSTIPESVRLGEMRQRPTDRESPTH